MSAVTCTGRCVNKRTYIIWTYMKHSQFIYFNKLDENTIYVGLLALYIYHSGWTCEVKLHSWTSFVAFPPQNARKQGEPWQFDSRSLKKDSDITKCLMEQNRRNMEQLLLFVLLTVFIHCKGLACAAITVSQILNTKASSETRETRKWYFRPSSERDQSLSWCRISGIPSRL